MLKNPYVLFDFHQVLGVDHRRQETCQHNKYPNVFALGDCSSLPTSKTDGMAGMAGMVGDGCPNCVRQHDRLVVCSCLFTFVPIVE